MSDVQLNVKELLRFAISMEESGVQFYQEMAKKAKGDLVKELQGLANDEKEHALLFTKWFNEINDDENTYLLEPDVYDFFNAYAKEIGFGDRKEEVPDSFIEALDSAIKTEERTIEYYAKMLELAKPESKELLNRIIAEETGHRLRLVNYRESATLYELYGN